MTLSKTGLKDIGHENCHWYGGQEDVVRLVRRTIVCANQFLSLKARVCLCFSCAPSLKIYERKWIVNVPVQGAIWRWTTPTATSISKNAGNVCVTTKYAFTVKGKRKMIHSCGMLLNGFIQGGAFMWAIIFQVNCHVSPNAPPGRRRLRLPPLAFPHEPASFSFQPARIIR